MTNTIVHDQPAPTQAAVGVADGEGLALAATWGHEDAMDGIDRRGSWYYRVGGAYHGAYNEGYDNALARMGCQHANTK